MKGPPGPHDDNGEPTPAKDTAFIPLPGNNGTDSTLEDLKSAHESVKSSIPNESVAAGRKESCDTGGGAVTAIAIGQNNIVNRVDPVNAGHMGNQGLTGEQKLDVPPSTDKENRMTKVAATASSPPIVTEGAMAYSPPSVSGLPQPNTTESVVSASRAHSHPSTAGGQNSRFTVSPLIGGSSGLLFSTNSTPMAPTLSHHDLRIKIKVMGFMKKPRYFKWLSLTATAQQITEECCEAGLNTRETWDILVLCEYVVPLNEREDDYDGCIPLTGTMKMPDNSQINPNLNERRKRVRMALQAVTQDPTLDMSLLLILYQVYIEFEELMDSSGSGPREEMLKTAEDERHELQNFTTPRKTSPHQAANEDGSSVLADYKTKKETKKPSCAVNVAVGSTGNEVNKGRMALGVDGESEWEDNDDKSMFSNNGGHPKQAKEPYGVSFG